MDQFRLMPAELLLGAAHGGDIPGIDVDITQFAHREEQAGVDPLPLLELGLPLVTGGQGLPGEGQPGLGQGARPLPRPGLEQGLAGAVVIEQPPAWADAQHGDGALAGEAGETADLLIPGLALGDVVQVEGMEKLVLQFEGDDGDLQGDQSAVRAPRQQLAACLGFAPLALGPTPLP